MLATQPGYTLINEPLHLRWRAAQEAGIDEWRTYIGPGEASLEVQDYIEKALAGRVACTRQFTSEVPLFKLRELLTGRKQVVKFVRANRMLHWIYNRFPIREIVLVLRHPCAVVASQLDYKHDAWRRATPPEIDELQTEYGGRIPDRILRRFKSTLANVESTAGHLAAVWCLDIYFPLHEQEVFPGLITTYERLLTREEEELKRIFQSLGEPVPRRALQLFEKASGSASSDLVVKGTRRQLSKWKTKLDARQIDEILSTVEAFGLDFYTDALEPDYSRIEASSEGVESQTT
ncbi:hypothetical protein GGQ10_000920 [Salinibacter ruber]|nr:hypothetical protein [Salinibacter ruber]